MTGGSARHGRRNNGLFAAEYAVVGDVDPRVGEHLLDVLGNRGIAAYLQPSADQHPITRLTTLPGRPVDRLFVDRRELGAAREFYDIATADTAGPIDPDGLADSLPGWSAFPEVPESGGAALRPALSGVRPPAGASRLSPNSWLVPLSSAISASLSILRGIVSGGSLSVRSSSDVVEL